MQHIVGSQADIPGKWALIQGVLIRSLHSPREHRVFVNLHRKIMLFLFLLIST